MTYKITGSIFFVVAMYSWLGMKVDFFVSFIVSAIGAVITQELYEYLEKNNITHIVEDYDILTGCESICNPFSSADRIIEAIERYEND